MQFKGDRPTVGMLGGGQLAMMLAAAGQPLGVRFVQLAPRHSGVAGHVDVMKVDYDDEPALRRLAESADVVTYESENVPVPSVELIAGSTPVRPGAAALATAGDRWREKDLFAELGVPTAPFARVASAAELDEAIALIGLPAVIKMRRLGYDGRGQAVGHTAGDLHEAWRAFNGVPMLYERLIPFDREISVVAVRGIDGETRFWDVGENVHRAGMLRSCLIPAPAWTADLDRRARDSARRIMDALDYVGVMALEMFQSGDELLANEIAPRVHNTGHWTMDGAATSQFENHVRAILGWPLGDTTTRGPTVMVNIVGTEPDLRPLLEIPGAHIHLYGKAPRPERKLGHVNVEVGSLEEGRSLMERLGPIAGPGG